MKRTPAMDGGSYRLIDAMVARLAERQKVTTRCANCDWIVTGPLDEVRAAFTGHRKQAHPFVRETLPNPRKKMLSPAEMRRAA